MLKCLIVIPFCVIAGCASNAQGQPETSVGEERLRNLANLASEQTKEIASLAKEITDARFITLTGEFNSFKTEQVKKFDDLETKVDDNHREVMQELRDIKEGQGMPWWIAMTMAGVGVGGGAGGVQVLRGKKQKPDLPETE